MSSYISGVFRKDDSQSSVQMPINMAGNKGERSFVIYENKKLPM